MTTKPMISLHLPMILLPIQDRSEMPGRLQNRAPRLLHTQRILVLNINHEHLGLKSNAISSTTTSSNLVTKLWTQNLTTKLVITTHVDVMEVVIANVCVLLLLRTLKLVMHTVFM
jgi:hypothetical protein